MMEASVRLEQRAEGLLLVVQIDRQSVAKLLELGEAEVTLIDFPRVAEALAASDHPEPDIVRLAVVLSEPDAPPS